MTTASEPRPDREPDEELTELVLDRLLCGDEPDAIVEDLPPTAREDAAGHLRLHRFLLGGGWDAPLPPVDRPRALQRFLRAWLEDVEAGAPRPLETYAEAHPGLEEDVAGWHRTLDALRDEAARPVGRPGRAEPPRWIGPFRVLGAMGRGGQGVVYRAVDTRIGRPVALKELSGLDLSSPEARRRFRREAELAARLDHPGVCAIHEFDLQAHVPYIAMRLVEGATLAEHLRRAREGAGRLPGAPPLPPRTGVEVLEVVGLLERMARAAHAAHEAGVVHRDLKPGNVMVTPEGEPVLLDFGLARDLSGELPTITEGGGTLGTPEYMSPEQIDLPPDRLDRRTDVYSLGVVLFECLTLERPFSAPTRAALLERIVRDTPPDPRRLNAALGRDLSVVAGVALEKDVGRRYAAAAELADDLARVARREPVHARPAGAVLRLSRWVQRRPALAAALVFLIAGLATSTALLVRTNAEREAKVEALEDSEKARRAADRARAETLMGSARLEKRRGRWRAALAHYDEAERLGFADSTLVSIGRIEAWQALMDHVRVDEELQRLLASDVPERHRAKVLLLRGDLLRSRLADVDAGVAEIEEALAAGTLAEADAAYGRAVVAEDPRATRRHLADALRADPAHRRANEMMGAYLAPFGPLDELAAFAERFAALYPEDPRVHVLRAFHLARSGRLQEGLAAVRRLEDDLPASEREVIEIALTTMSSLLRPSLLERLCIDGTSPEVVARFVLVLLRVRNTLAEVERGPYDEEVVFRVSYPRSVVVFFRDVIAAARHAGADFPGMLETLARFPILKDLVRDLEPGLTFDELHRRYPGNAVMHLLHGLVLAKKKRWDEALGQLEHFADAVRGTEWERFGRLLCLHTGASAAHARRGEDPAGAESLRERALRQLVPLLASPELSDWHFETIGTCIAPLGQEELTSHVARTHRLRSDAPEAGLATEVQGAWFSGDLESVLTLGASYRELARHARPDVLARIDEARRRIAATDSR